MSIFEEFPERPTNIDVEVARILADVRAGRPTVKATAASFEDPPWSPLPDEPEEAYARGFADGADHVSRCCGCAGDPYPRNPYDGSEIQP